MDRVGVREWKL